MNEFAVKNNVELSVPPHLDKITSSESAKDKGSFGKILTESIGEVNRLQKEADKAAYNLVTGKETDIHGTMIALEKADVSFRLMMQVRNKIVAAYEEIKRMQV
ncbi:MAG: flagellar hook-basal body complex protein FliE [Deltaproteobacteria bacterium]|nr:flagellar hook-basal body complex protein FliE [Deltaproteobacteria bacterium]